VAVHTDQVTTECHREAGTVHAGYQFWRRLGVEEILSSVGLSRKARMLTCAMTLNRLIYPLSEHAMPDWIRNTAIPDILGIDFDSMTEDPLYRNLDRLHPNRDRIESALVERERNLFNLDATVFFYDITSTYFEGEANSNHKARRGYSRDSRPDCKQVIVGLAIGKEGFPLAHEVMEGNLQDRQTLDTMLGLMDERVGLKEGQTIVIDRGMAFDENIEQIRGRHLHYVVASRQSERNAFLSELEDIEGFEQIHRSVSPLNPFQKKSEVKIKMIRGGDITYVLCISSGRIEKDKTIRQKQEKQYLVDVARLRKRVEGGRLKAEASVYEAIGRLKERYPRVARYYILTYDVKKKELLCELDKEKMEKAESLDESYILKTDRDDLSADEIWRIYMTLTRAEAAFRAMKSPLSERPIFHQVETHIFLCALAYHLLVAIEKTLLDKGVHTSWWTVRQTLKTHQVCTAKLPADNGKILNIRKASTPEPAHRELYKLLNIPEEVMPPKKYWTIEDGDKVTKKSVTTCF
jgi:transposase